MTRIIRVHRFEVYVVQNLFFSESIDFPMKNFVYYIEIIEWLKIYQYLIYFVV